MPSTVASTSSSSSSSPVVLPYYSLSELSAHNLAGDCWLSLFGFVLDLSSLVAANPGSLSDPIIKFAGSDISHWFNADTREPRTAIDQRTGIELYFLPHGRFLHIPPAEPTASWDSNFGLPWWSDPQYRVGRLSSQPRKIRIVNVLSGQDELLSVCGEESLTAIAGRYLAFNRHGASYTWKRLGRVLDMNKTLEENGIPDESKEFIRLNMNENEFIPAIHVYFNDDLTVD